MKNTVKWLWAAALAAAMVFSACDDGGSTVKTVHVSSVSLNKGTLVLAAGQTAVLTPTIQPSGAANKKVNWSSGNTGVATVTNGTVTAVAPGTATITVTTADRNKKATCAVTVTAPVAVTGVTLNETTLSLTVGNTAALTATVAPPNATNKNVSWTSDDDDVATVSNGTVTAIAQGTATITVTTADGNKTATCAVTVQADTGPITSETGIEMVWIPAGTFTMGSPDTESGRYDWEGPQHSVTLTKGFYMGKYQVTQEQYEEVMGTNPSYFTTANGRAPADGESDEKRPVEYVTWYDAVEFCNKLSVLEELEEVYTITGRTPASGYPITDATVTADFTKNGYRLPTEAQWEYACRAGTTTAFNNGNDDYTDAASVGAIAWYNGNSGSKTHEAGLKEANEFGLYDMHGNVWEWCWDWYEDYSSEAQTDPAGPTTGTYRVNRGGSWNNAATSLRSAYRNSDNPYYRYNSIGLRLVRP